MHQAQGQTSHPQLPQLKAKSCAHLPKASQAFWPESEANKLTQDTSGLCNWSNLLSSRLMFIFWLTRVDRHKISHVMLFEVLGPCRIVYNPIDNAGASSMLPCSHLHLHCLLSLQSRLVLLGLMAPSQPYSCTRRCTRRYTRW